MKSLKTAIHDALVRFNRCLNKVLAKCRVGLVLVFGLLASVAYLKNMTGAAYVILGFGIFSGVVFGPVVAAPKMPAPVPPSKPKTQWRGGTAQGHGKR